MLTKTIDFNINITGPDDKINKRKSVEKLPEKFFNSYHQIGLLNSIYLDNKIKDEQYKKPLIKELDKKIASYKNQDIIKKKYMDNNINREETIEKLVISKMNCYYCRRKMKLFYEEQRDPLQWTLDRVDNKQPHQNDNVVIACLECNLKRRMTDKDKFLFTKQLKIVKQEY